MSGSSYSYLIELKAVSLAPNRGETFGALHCGKLLTQIDVKRKSMSQKDVLDSQKSTI